MSKHQTIGAILAISIAFLASNCSKKEKEVSEITYENSKTNYIQIVHTGVSDKAILTILITKDSVKLPIQIRGIVINDSTYQSYSEFFELKDTNIKKKPSNNFGVFKIEIKNGSNFKYYFLSDRPYSVDFFEQFRLFICSSKGPRNLVLELNELLSIIGSKNESCIKPSYP